METTWPEAVERVSSFLRDAGAEARLEQFSDGTPTAADAAAAVGCELDQIVKSLVLVCDDKPVVALVPGDRRGDPEKIAARTKEYEERFLSPFIAAERGYIDDVIMPHSTRRRIARTLAMLRGKQVETPWRKHDNLPV